MSAVSDLLTNYQHVIADLTLVTGGGGIFDVVVDGTTIYSKHETGRHANDGEVLAAFEAFVGPDVRATAPEAQRRRVCSLTTGARRISC